MTYSILVGTYLWLEHPKVVQQSRPKINSGIDEKANSEAIKLHIVSVS
jgi:hypothetical protein